MSDEFRSEGTTTLDYLRVRYEWLGRIIDETEGRVATLTAERDKLRAACETLLACDRETDPGTGLALLHEAVEKAREALKQQ